MSSEDPIWRVTCTQEVTVDVFIQAPDGDAAEAIAKKEVDFDDLGDPDTSFSAWRVKGAPSGTLVWVGGRDGYWEEAP